MKKQFRLKDYKGKYVMHCDTEEKAKMFLKYLDDNGKTWFSGDSYLDFTFHTRFGDNTVYSFNNGSYDNKTSVKNSEYIILNFDDFDWTEDGEAKGNNPFGFKVGQKVWDMAYGWGKITDIDKEAELWIKVQFKTIRVSYNKNGAERNADFRTLFFDEIPIPESTLKPQRWRAEKGEQYWCVGTIDGRFTIIMTTEKFWDVSNNKYNQHNYFKTEQEAQNTLDKIIAMLKSDNNE